MKFIDRIKNSMAYQSILAQYEAGKMQGEEMKKQHRLKLLNGDNKKDNEDEAHTD